MGTITLTLLLKEAAPAEAEAEAVLVKGRGTTIVIDTAKVVPAELLQEAAGLVAAVIKQAREEDAEVLVEAAVAVPL
jgi:hypothetical protein